MKIKKLLCAMLAPVMLFTACSGEGGEAAADVNPADVVSAVLNEVPISSSVEKGTDEVESYYSGIETSELDSAAFSLCGSGALPDEIGVFKFKSSDAAKSAETALQSKLESRKESFATYTPDEMYKLESAKIFSTGNYAVYIALADNEKAKEIVDGKLKG